MAAVNDKVFSLDREKEEFLRQATRSATLIALSLQSMGGEVPDDEESHEVFAQSLGLPNGEAFRVVRDQLVKQHWAFQLETTDGPILKLTSVGTERCDMLKKGMEARMARERAEARAAETGVSQECETQAEGDASPEGTSTPSSEVRQVQDMDGQHDN